MCWVKFTGKLAFVIPMGMLFRWKEEQFEAFKAKNSDTAVSIRVASGHIISAPVCDLEWHSEVR